MLNLLLFRHKGYTRVMENRILQDHRRITRREPPMMHMNILICGTIPVSLYMPLSFFFNTEMKCLTATPSGENTGTLIAWSILQNNHSVHLWVLLLAMCLFFSISLYYAQKTLFASLEKFWSLMDCVYISFMLLWEFAFTQFVLYDSNYCSFVITLTGMTLWI